MSRRLASWSLLAVAALAAAAFLLPAGADWLVTKDGAQIETDGPWKDEGRLVVFKRPDGTYASMRRSELDLEASERLTLERAKAVEQPKRQADTRAERREPVARLTEKELPPRGRQQQTSEAEEAAAASLEAGQSGPLQVVNWREVTEPESPGVTFAGQVRNTSEHMALGVTLTVTLSDENGDEIASADARLTTNALPPGAVGGFRASFPGVFAFSRADFDVSGTLVRSESSGEAPEEGEGGRR